MATLPTVPTGPAKGAADGGGVVALPEIERKVSGLGAKLAAELGLSSENQRLRAARRR